jgi:ornithine cyclodeaminase
MPADAPVVELGAIINGDADGRTDESQVTVCDLTGVGVQDTMIAIQTLKIAARRNIGLTVY